MPITRCMKDGKIGYKFGEKGKCYTYTLGDEKSRKAAKSKALKQGRAIENSMSIIRANNLR